MNITDLLKLKQDQLLPLIRQVADRVRNSRTPQKHRKLREKLLEACDMVGFPNPYSGDLAYNQAAQEEGWIRIKPLTRPRESTIYAETFSGKMTLSLIHI